MLWIVINKGFWIIKYLWFVNFKYIFKYIFHVLIRPDVIWKNLSRPLYHINFTVIYTNSRHNVRHQVITWANIDPDLCHHTMSLEHSQLIPISPLFYPAHVLGYNPSFSKHSVLMTVPHARLASAHIVWPHQETTTCYVTPSCQLWCHWWQWSFVIKHVLLLCWFIRFSCVKNCTSALVECSFSAQNRTNKHISKTCFALIKHLLSMQTTKSWKMLMNNQFKAQSLNRKFYRKYTSYFSVTCFKHVGLLWPISALDRKQVRGLIITTSCAACDNRVGIMMIHFSAIEFIA